MARADSKPGRCADARARVQTVLPGAGWSQRPDSNRRPAVYKTAALPTELRWRPHWYSRPSRARAQDRPTRRPEGADRRKPALRGQARPRRREGRRVTAGSPQCAYLRAPRPWPPCRLLRRRDCPHASNRRLGGRGRALRELLLHRAPVQPRSRLPLHGSGTHTATASWASPMPTSRGICTRRSDTWPPSCARRSATPPARVTPTRRAHGRCSAWTRCCRAAAPGTSPTS